MGSYIIQVNDTHVYSKDDIEESLGIFSKLSIYDKSPQATLTFATVKSSTNMEDIPQIQIDQIRNIVRHLYEMCNDTPLEPSYDLMDYDIVNVLKSGRKLI